MMDEFGIIKAGSTVFLAIIVHKFKKANNTQKYKNTD